VVKGFQVLDVRVWFPGVVTGGPSNIKFDGLSDESVAGDLVDEPLVIIRHSEIVEAFAFTTREYRVVIRFMGSQQRHMEPWMDSTRYEFWRQFQIVVGSLGYYFGHLEGTNVFWS
jgi:hypothetical protein